MSSYILGFGITYNHLVYLVQGAQSETNSASSEVSRTTRRDWHFEYKRMRPKLELDALEHREHEDYCFVCKDGGTISGCDVEEAVTMEVDNEDEEGCNQQPTTAAAVVDLVGSDDNIMVLDDLVSNPQPTTPQPLFIYPSASARDEVPVLETDRRLLDGRQELNDTILHVFCRYKEEEILGRADGI
eukprot:jgi/Chlat1/1829/Chrsp14S02226